MISHPALRLSLGAMVLAAILVSAPLSGELSDEERDRGVRQARQLVKDRNHEAAISKLEVLYQRDPYDAVIVKELFKLLVETARYARAERMMKDYLERKRHDVRAMSDLASLYFKTGRIAEGQGLLDQIVGTAPGERWPYELSIDVLLDHERDGEVLDLIAAARKALADSTVFAMNAAKIHMDAGRKEMATREYLLGGITKGRSHTASIECIAAMARDDEARPSIIAALEAARALDDLKEIASKTLWEVYLLDGDCPRALAELKALVAEDKSFAKSLTGLAERSSDAGCYQECGEAYGLAAEYSEDRGKVPALLFEKGTCEVRAGSVEQALNTYDEIVSEYGNSVWGSKASIARGRIYRDLGSPEAALEEANRAMAARHAGDERYVAILLKADCLIEMGLLDQSFEAYDLVEINWKAGYAQEAFFNLGEVSFYKGDFDGAISYYNVTLRQFPDEPRANDAIDRLLLLKSSKSGEGYRADLKEFAAACLLKRQGKTGEARAILQEVSNSDAEGVKVESLRNLSEIYVEEGAFDLAVKTYKLVGESLDTYLSPSALEAVGDIYLDLGRTNEAISAYEDVILRFPDSVSAGEARRKIEVARREPAEGS